MEECPHLRLFKEAYFIAYLYSQRRQLRDLWRVLAGSASQYTDAIMLTLGTGVGGGIIMGKRIYSGADNMGAELGHTKLVYNGERCTCGQKGCLEAYCSSTALIRIMKEALQENKDTLIWKLCGEDENKSMEKSFSRPLNKGIPSLNRSSMTISVNWPPESPRS